MRAAIYARYSSDNQRDASIDDQLRVCRALAEREGWTDGSVFVDRARSGASTLRPGYQDLLAAVRRRECDVVLTEALDRISRDQEDTASFFKAVGFAGARIVTVAEGEITELHVGLKGTMNALFLKDLAKKTHRGLQGRIEEGRSAGGICFGYDVVTRLDERQVLVRGERRIDEAEAAIIRRIFTLYAGGASPIGIARTLNAERVPSPRGDAWRDSTIRGHAARGTGILRNELYAGRLVWNRMRFLKDPRTGRRVSRPNPPSARVIEEVPNLRIVPDDLWRAVQDRLADLRVEVSADDPACHRFQERKRPVHLLSGKIFCGCCGSQMTNLGRDRIGCPSRRLGRCGSAATIARPELDGIVLEALGSEMMRPECLQAFAAEFTAEWNRLGAERSATASATRIELASVERKLDGLIEAIADGIRAQGLQQKLDDLEARKADLVARLEAPAPAVPSLHPSLPELYRGRVENLAAALSSGDDPAVLEAARSLVDRVTLTPDTVAPRGFKIEIDGEIASMLRLGGAGAETIRAMSVQVVAGTGFEPVTFRL